MPTIQSILSKSANYSVPRLDFELILAHLIQEDRTYLYSHSEHELSQSKFKKFVSLIKKRQSGFPLAYLVNSKPFFNLDFYVDERVLIPRPETELIVEKVLEIKPNTMLDIGVGSGTIALTCAYNLPGLKVTAMDICSEALKVASLNAQKYNLEIDFHCSDLLGDIENELHFDVITANLPYIGEEKHAFVSDSTRKYEPDLALFSGSDGLEHYRRLLAQVKLKKVSFNYLIGEFGFGQEKAIMDLLQDYNYTIENDLAGIPRIFIITN